MTRSRTQIDDDARSAAEAVRSAGRPLRLVEIADVIRRQGRPQTDKQANVTAERARELGLLRRRGACLWDAPEPENVPLCPPADEQPASPTLLIYCARRMLELPPSAEVSRAAVRLLDEAARLLPPLGHGAPGPRPTADLVEEPVSAPLASQDNGASHDANREIEVLVTPVAR